MVHIFVMLFEPPAFSTLDIPSPFSAPVYHTAVTGSTMEAAKALVDAAAVAGAGADVPAPHGTVILADYQLAGRGRFDRPWQSLPAENLLCTIILRFNAALPRALTLRTGLAVSNAVDRCIAPETTAVKWPNDVLFDGRKIAGILTEGSVSAMLATSAMSPASPASPPFTVFTGIGVNVLQKTFSGLDRSAASIALINGTDGMAAAKEDDQPLRLLLLQYILEELWAELVSEHRIQSWRDRIGARLYRRGDPIQFAPGGRGSDSTLPCILTGIGEEGELLVQTETGMRSFVSGEIRLWE